ncbi:uncharacterized protein Triagg1_6521 [Trichoderma aggressivum f. europaeum]|uniref:Uncharacterized protein n=1 Tax=Trichoderma aggressivum f. europaeum TaxID=173218 RepID=A0AAE1LYI3_9HYPO|nr:hypothetical protein Triagg1_6521 [Trichoderma aggressivum f. europaeum]
MSEAKGFIDASDQANAIVHGPQGEMDIYHLWLFSPSMTSFHLGLSGYLCDGFDIGWVSSVTVRLYHGFIHMGEITCPHKPIIPEPDNFIEIFWGQSKESEMHIKNMMAFKRFFEGFMPKVGASHEPDIEGLPTADLEVSASGHQLMMSVDLGRMPRLKPVVESLTLSGDEFEIVMNIENQSPFGLDFNGNFHCVLEKDEKEIGYLNGELAIGIDGGKHVFRGRLHDEASGTAILKGDSFLSSDKKDSWLQYALRLFKVEINMDEIVVKTSDE